MMCAGAAGVVPPRVRVTWEQLVANPMLLGAYQASKFWLTHVPIVLYFFVD